MTAFRPFPEGPATLPRHRVDAVQRAQLLAFGPILFQAIRVARDRGLLRELIARGSSGATVGELAAATNTTEYGVTVLLEGCMAAGVVTLEGSLFRPTAVAFFMERDPMTQANMNFVQDVCYRAMDHLDEAIATGTPAGLRELGPWKTVYEGLRELGEPARSSWLAFDHFYSDDSFPLVLPTLFAGGPRRVLDVGGNTGKFALACLAYDEKVHVTIADLPGQLVASREAIHAEGAAARVAYHPVNLLSLDAALPKEHDLIWMSQFLCCFSEAEIVHILGVAKATMGPETKLFIMDNFWDRQATEAARVVLQSASLYFTCVANGNSRLYDSATFFRCIEHAGLRVQSERNNIGLGHTLLECVLP